MELDWLKKVWDQPVAVRIGIYTKLPKHDKTIAMKKKQTSALKQTRSKEIPTIGGIAY
jgi:hypothetical protein